MLPYGDNLSTSTPINALVYFFVEDKNEISPVSKVISKERTLTSSEVKENCSTFLFSRVWKATACRFGRYATLII